MNKLLKIAGLVRWPGLKIAGKKWSPEPWFKVIQYIHNIPTTYVVTYVCTHSYVHMAVHLSVYVLVM